jgi:magnesium-transporting ATPase (P-type)
MDSVFGNDFLLGTGIGNFSSRASLFLSGQYLDNQLFFPIVPSEATKELIMSYYSKNNGGMNIFGYDGLSVVNEPFSQYTTMFSEFGLVGFSLFVVWFLSLIYYSIKIKNILLFVVIFFSLLIFIGNNWLEFVSYISLFFLILKYSIIRSKKCIRLQL